MNLIHLYIMMNFYSIRNFFTGNGAVWFSLSSNDLENMIKTIIIKKNLELKNKDVLDLGCGSGVMLQYLEQEEQVNVFGVDLLFLNTIQCKKKTRKR